MAPRAQQLQAIADDADVDPDLLRLIQALARADAREDYAAAQSRAGKAAAAADSDARP